VAGSIEGRWRRLDRAAMERGRGHHGVGREGRSHNDGEEAVCGEGARSSDAK
jgi:hypothetical protein